MSRKQQHVILRDTSRGSLAGPFDIGLAAESTAANTPAAGMPEPKVDSDDLTARDVELLSRDRSVMGIAPVMPTILVEPVPVPAAAAVGAAWGIAAVGADVSALTGAGVTPALLDTGIDAAHPAFAGVTLTQQDFSGDGNGDVKGHGTHCAGTVFGRDVAGQRIGVARGVTNALVGKVLKNDGRGDSEMLFRGIQWATDNRAHVISMSLGFDFAGLVERLVKKSGFPIPVATSAALEAYRGNLRMFDALMAMVRARGAFGASPVVVAAAGNESDRDANPEFEIAASLPAAAEGVVSVGALAQSAAGLAVPGFSNTLPQVCAPGVDIPSAKVGGGLRLLSGTSMACPHVAGVAVLWWEALLALPLPASANAVVARLLATARTNVFATGVDIADRGAGIVTAP
jgi:subtilisin family serine protease